MSDLRQKTSSASWLSRFRSPLLLAGPLVVALAGVMFYLGNDGRVTTDDAYIQVAHAEISSVIAGQVTQLLVKDNQPVRKGDLLFTLDDRAYKIALAEAKAQDAAARLQIAAMKATYLQRQADRQAAEDTANFRQTELDRQKKLVAIGVASQAQFDQADHALQAARQQVASAKQAIANVLANLGGNPDIAVEQHPSVQQAQAQIDRALLMLSYCKIQAPVDGTVSKVEQLQPGDYVIATSPVFSLMSSSDQWVEANFKETDLTYMKVGQKAVVEIDSYPGRKFAGRLTSLSPGTGSSFSLLPPENASGNWVKVVQRLAVRVALDPLPVEIQLRAGMSAQVTIDTEHHRSL